MLLSEKEERQAMQREQYITEEAIRRQEFRERSPMRREDARVQAFRSPRPLDNKRKYGKVTPERPIKLHETAFNAPVNNAADDDDALLDMLE